MKMARASIGFLITTFFTVTCLSVGAQQSTSQTKLGLPAQSEKPESQAGPSATKPIRRRRRAIARPVIPPMTILHNPEYLSGEASITVAANSNPLIRIGIAQNGVTLIEFPASDKFFAVHAGNSDLVTVEKSPSLKRDHHLILRAGNGFIVPSARAKRADAIVPATSIIAQMDSGMAITLMIYPVPLLKQQAHRLVINYNRDEVMSSRRTAGLATNLRGLETDSQSEVVIKSVTPSAVDSSRPWEPLPELQELQKVPKPNFKKPSEDAVSEAVANPGLFKNWSEQRHSLRISTVQPRDLNDTVRLVIFAVRNTGAEPLRLIAGYPDLYVETLNENHRPVEAGTRVEKLYQASSSDDNLISPGATRYFALAYEAPILGAQQHLKIVVAHMNAADEPAMADLTSVSR